METMKPRCMVQSPTRGSSHDQACEVHDSVFAVTRADWKMFCCFIILT